jgi:hypothetical protein
MIVTLHPTRARPEKLQGCMRQGPRVLTLAYTGRIHSRSDDCFGGGHRNIRATDTVGESRSYFGLWAIMKSPLLLSSNLPELSAELIAIVNNTEVIRVNQVRTLQFRFVGVCRHSIPIRDGAAGSRVDPPVCCLPTCGTRTRSESKRGNCRSTARPCRGSPGSNRATADQTACTHVVWGLQPLPTLGCGQ